MDVDTIEKVIQQFYFNADGRQEANQWLTRLQLSSEAWEFSWLLLDVQKAQEVQFFGATCLHTRILKYWFELPSERFPDLKDRLLQKILEFCSRPAHRLIANKLCLSLSALMIHTISDEWPGAVTDLVTLFQENQVFRDILDETRYILLLEVLAGLADDLESANLGLKSGKRPATRMALVNNFPTVQNVLQTLLGAGIANSIRDRALRCLTSWISFGMMLPDIQPLIDEVFACLQTEALFETAVETLIAAFTLNEPSKYPKTVQKYLHQLVQLSPMWQQCVQADNTDKCREMARLFVNVAEENAQLLLAFVTGTEEEQRSLALAMFDIIMRCTAIPGSYPGDETVSDLTFGFWYTVQDLIVGSTAELYDKLLQVFTSIYLSLTQVLLQKVQFPEDVVYNQYSEEEKEQFRCYRQDVADTIMYAYCLLKEKQLAVLNAYLASISAALPDVRWQDVECILYILTGVTQEAIAAYDDPEGPLETSVYGADAHSLYDSIIVDVVNLLTKLKFTNIHLLTACLQVIGAFAGRYNAQPELLSLVFPVILLHGMNHPDSVMFATRALKDICMENISQLAPYAQGILSVCHHILLQGSLAPKNAFRLLACVGHVLSCLAYSDICLWLDKFLPPITSSLGEAIAVAPTQQTKFIIIEKLQMLTWLFDTLDVKKDDAQCSTEQQPVLLIMRELLPVLQAVLSHWVRDSTVIETVMELLKRTLHTLMDDFNVILKEVCHLLTGIYNYTQHTSVLDIVRQLALMFFTDASGATLVRDTFHFVSTKSLEAIQADPRSKTDLLESYMNLCVQVCKKCLQLIQHPSYPLELSLFAAVLGVGFPEAPTMKACCSFLVEIYSKADQLEGVSIHTLKLAPTLYDIMLKAIGGSAPRANLEHITPVLLALNVSFFEVSSNLLNTLMSQENYPCPSVTKMDKERFVKDVLRERVNKRRLKETIYNFSLLCRGMAGTIYAQQTSTQHLM